MHFVFINPIYISVVFAQILINFYTFGNFLFVRKMPKYYCDYCDAFLTHDSPSVRKTHNGGRKHKENVRMYYQAWMEEQAQKLIDATTRAFTSQRMLPAAAPGFMPPVSVPVPTMIPPRGPFVNPMAMVRPPMMPPSMAGFFTPPVLPPGMMTAAGNGGGAAIPLPVVTSAIMPTPSTAAVNATNGAMPQQSPLRTAIKQQPQE